MRMLSFLYKKVSKILKKRGFARWHEKVVLIESHQGSSDLLRIGLRKKLKS